MDKEYLLKILWETLKAGSLISTGAGAFLLFSPNNEKTVEIAKFEDGGEVIVKNARTSKGKWIYEEEYHDSNFLLSCNGKDGEELKKSCYRRLKSKYQEYPIHLYLTKPTYNNPNGWRHYKFTYSGNENLEEGNKKEYIGECYVGATNNSTEEDKELRKADNPCNENNVPDGWTRDGTKI